jgi:hypothetical protein
VSGGDATGVPAHKPRENRETVNCPAAAPHIQAKGGGVAKQHRGHLLKPQARCAMPTTAIIPDRGEFIDVLHALKRGHVLVNAGQHAGGWVVDGGTVYSSYDPLLRYELVQEYENPAGFEHVRYFRLTERGRDFAERAWQAWRQRPLVERLAVRLLG